MTHARLDLLFGSDEPPAPAETLSAGPLSASLQDGNLRHVRFGGHEAIRAVSCVVRDDEWGTVTPEISNLAIGRRDDGQGFTVSYDALCRKGAQSYRYRARIEGRPDGIVFHMAGEAITDFSTARLGFVVLHPIEGVSGAPVRVLHVDGREERSHFPALIEPYQPFMDIRALTHEVAPGVEVTCRMEGDSFEMEDQRNWTDASYKTYVRPIGLPWPYLIPRGEKQDQSVSLAFCGALLPEVRPTPAVRLQVGGSAGRMPRIGLQLAAAGPVTDDERALLAGLHPAHLRLRFDLRHHGEAELRRAAGLATALGAKLQLEAVLPGHDLTAEAHALACRLAAAGAQAETVFVAPAADLKGTLPGSPWPDCPPLEAVYAAVRAALPDVRLGGGSYCFFTELNRKRPPAGLLDVVTFGTAATVHAADDVSVMETLSCLPAVFKSARAIAGGGALHVGPSAIGCRDNPYGGGPAPNPDGRRMTMTDRDPRQRGLFAAAWSAGFVARCVEAGIEEATLATPADAFGVLERADDRVLLRPLYHVLRAAGLASGCPARPVLSSDPARVLAFAWEGASGPEMMAANLTAGPVQLRIHGADGLAWRGVLDAGTLDQAGEQPRHLDATEPHDADAELTLEAYGVCRLGVERG